MIIFDENNDAIVLHDIKAPILVDYFWGLDLELMDFTLNSLNVMIETKGPSLEIRVNGFHFWIPSTWYVLIYDMENSILDISRTDELAWKNFTAVTYGPRQLMITPTELFVTNYDIDRTIISPALNNNLMLCHPISPEKWIMVTPNNVYNKFLKNTTIGDLF